MKNYVMNENEQLLYDREYFYDWEEWCNEIDLLNCLGEHEWDYRYHISEKGRISLFCQCSYCGKRHGSGSSLKHDTVPNLKEKIKLGQIKQYDLDLLNEKSATFDKYLIYREKKHAEIKTAESITKKENYKIYIGSDKWKAIRLKVLKRDNNVCQACLEAPANDVHHLTYDNFGDELMYELISVCRDCHFNRIHKDKV